MGDRVHLMCAYVSGLQSLHMHELHDIMRLSGQDMLPRPI